MKISCCMILGNITAETVRTFQSIEGFVDEFCFLVTRDDNGGTQKIINIFKSMTTVPVNVKVDLESYLYEDGIPKSFADMRNSNFDMASHDIICWFDSDDVVACGCPETFKKQIIDDFEEFDLDGIHAEYDYEITPSGHVQTRQMRERFLRKGKTTWKSPLHEVACFLKRPNVTFYRRDVFYVEHKRDAFDPAQVAQQTLRNKLVIERFMEGNPDYEIRLDFYYGHVLLEGRKFEEAIKHYDKYLLGSGFPEERYLAHLKKASCYRGLNQHKKAIECCFEAIDQSPEWSEGYSDLAESYFERKEWRKVVLWTAQAMQRAVESPRRGTVWNPLGIDLRPRYMMRQACIELGDWGNALACNEALLKLYPGEPELKECGERIEKEIQFLNDVTAHSKAIDQLPEEKRSGYVKKLSPELQRYGKFGKYIAYDDIKGERKSIAIFCGEAPEHWGPSSVKKGIGGSEEAVINMSKRLVALGWHVEVFCNAIETGVIDGVVWRDWATINTNHYDVFVVWRAVSYFDSDINADKKYLWLHDLQEEEWYDDRILQRIDRIFCLSQFHRDTVPYIPDDKVWLTTNGIDIDHFSNDRTNEPHRVIYASSPDRGLERVLDAWPKIKESVPEAELDVYYGFNKAFDARAELEPELKKWKEKMLTKLVQNGVTYHGMVSHQEIANAFSKAGIWAYPTPFGEISCITAMKAQASGAIPVVSRYSAINETVRHGIAVGPPNQSQWESKDLDRWAVEMIQLLRDPSS
jgi:glycosyltransferase involved in cell wall biosynthesis